MKTMHLFAGIGGGLLCDLILGHKPIIAVEWDKYACRVLRERAADGWFPDLHVYEGDVRLFDPSEYTGRIHTLHAGFPCQDISNAGKQAGLGEGTRSGLYREVLRIADVVRPREIYLENVSAILSNGFGTVLGDLAALGYDAKWICIRASDVGANHQRDRWWLLARHVRDTEHTGLNAAEDGGSTTQRSDNNPQGTQQTSESTGSSKQHEELADSTSEGANRHAVGTEQKYALPRNSGEDVADTTSPGRIINSSEGNQNGGKTKSYIRGMVDEFSTGMDGCWWEVEPEIGRVATDVKERVNKLKGLGNAQVPLQAAVAYKMLERLYEAKG